jgi:two-component system CheB/CheR fusion protein
MLLHKLEHLGDYLDHLQTNPEEIDALFHDITINVTGFFREPETFEALREAVLPRLIKERAEDAPLRIWVPGCSTGEEAYSLAMVILEYLGTRSTEVPVQIFGTDIDDRAVERARAGVYLERFTADVSAERLKRFFTEVSGGYKISKTIRDMCVFARHDVTRDPPFSKLDLVCCRNVLIYLGTTLQRRVLQIFHYALKPGGFLMLGSSESIGASADLFQFEHKDGKIYAKKTTATTPAYDFTARPYQLESPRPVEADAAAPSPEVDLRKEADRLVVARYGPPGVIVNHAMDVLGFRSRTGRYLEPTPGVASLNLLKLVRQELMVDLRNTFNRALKGEVEAAREGLLLRHNGQVQHLDLRVLPLKGASTAEHFFLVLFEDRGTAPVARAPDEEYGKADSGEAGGAETPADARIRELEQELSNTREYMQSVIEDSESTNEELQSANEEIQSTNEDLQSTNEELETAKEELQSTNEELTTVNEELENRNSELTATNNDLRNLLASVNLPILMLDQRLRARQFTPQAKRLLNLIDTDVGRPIADIRPNVELPELERIAQEVMDSMTVATRDVSDKQGNPYSVSVRPYRTHDQRIDGVVITFFELAQFDRLSRLATAVRDANDAVTVLDLTGRFRAWNPAAVRLYGYTEQEALGLGLEAIVPEGELDAARALMDRVRRGERVPPQRVGRRTKSGRELKVWLTPSLLVDRSGAPKALSSIECPVEPGQEEGADGR